MFQQLTFLPHLRALELVWDISMHGLNAFGRPRDVPRRYYGILQSLVKAAFDRAVSPGFDVLFTMLQAGYGPSYWEKWQRGSEKGVVVGDEEAVELWKADW